MFTMYRVYNETSCSTDPDSPSPVDSLPLYFNITYCTVWTYNLPRTLFHDIENGETIGMKLELLNGQGLFYYKKHVFFYKKLEFFVKNMSFIRKVNFFITNMNFSFVRNLIFYKKHKFL